MSSSFALPMENQLVRQENPLVIEPSGFTNVSISIIVN